MNETPALQLDTNLVRVAASGQSSNQGGHTERGSKHKPYRSP